MLGLDVGRLAHDDASTESGVVIASASAGQSHRASELRVVARKDCRESDLTVGMCRPTSSYLA